MRKDILNLKSEIISWVNNQESKAFICRQLNCRPQTLEKYLKFLDIDYKGNKGLKNKKSTKKKSYEEVKNSSWIGSHRIKIKLLNEGLKEEKCEICNLKEWNGKKIPLELHHIDGDRFNNELYNLQIICPNCHAQTPNYSGRKNKKNKIRKIKKLNKENRKVERPSNIELLDDIKILGYKGTGRKYGVSDNAIRKWVKIYEKYPDDGTR